MKTIKKYMSGLKPVETIIVSQNDLKDEDCRRVLIAAIADYTKGEIAGEDIRFILNNDAKLYSSKGFELKISKVAQKVQFEILEAVYSYALFN